jgi:hypothetical protein
MSVDSFTSYIQRIVHCKDDILKSRQLIPYMNMYYDDSVEHSDGRMEK